MTPLGALLGVLAGVVWAGLAHAGPADRALRHGEAAPDAAPDAAHAAARMGGRLPRSLQRQAGPRGLAWVSVGRLGVLDEAVLAHAEAALLTPGNAREVRSRAAWALGELSRGRPAAEVAPVVALLEAAMATELAPATAQQLVEAFAKAYPPHSHSFDEDLAATRALNTLAARQRAALPGVYYVLLDRVMTADVAVALVAEGVARARQEPTEAHLAEAYSAVLLAVRWLASQQDQLLASLSTQQTALELAFDGLLSALSLDDRRLTLMLLWSLGEVAGDPAFAGLAGPGVAELAGAGDPVQRSLAAWALYRLRADLTARTALREVVLGTERSPLVYRVLAGLRSAERELDPVQKLVGVEPPGAP